MIHSLDQITLRYFSLKVARPLSSKLSPCTLLIAIAIHYYKHLCDKQRLSSETYPAEHV